MHLHQVTKFVQHASNANCGGGAERKNSTLISLQHEARWSHEARYPSACVSSFRKDQSCKRHHGRTVLIDVLILRHRLAIWDIECGLDRRKGHSYFTLFFDCNHAILAEGMKGLRLLI